MNSVRQNNDEGAVTPIHLTCEYLINPMGVDVKHPRLSWQLEARQRGQVQSACRIMAASSMEALQKEEELLWDTGKFFSVETLHIPYGGPGLISGQRLFWKVRCWDGEDRPGRDSEHASLEMGLLEKKDWDGGWIEAGEEWSAPLFRKSILLEKEVKRARAYISGLGYYELYINGRKAGDHVLEPGWTDYTHRNTVNLLYPIVDSSTKKALYVTHDVTDFFTRGENVLGVILGNGWFNQVERRVEGKLDYGLPRLLIQLDLELETGERMRVSSDASWKTSFSPITFNNVYKGEKYDARLEQMGWCREGFDDSRWLPAKPAPDLTGLLRAQMSPPDRVIALVEPVERREAEPGLFVYDMGVNLSGWARLRVEGPVGTTVILRFCEELDAMGMPDFSSTGGKGQIQEDWYILKGSGIETYEPRFTWHGFRYVCMWGYPGNPPENAILGVEIHSDVASSGRFECSNPLINRIQEACRRTLLNNLHGGVLSDCPHRERLGYTGDGQVVSEAAMMNFNMGAFFTKWIDDLCHAQNRETGYVPHTVPFYGGGGGPAWGSAMVLLPWNMYLHYGDKAILEACCEPMARWLAYLGSKTDGRHLVIKEEYGPQELGGWSFLGEWCTPQNRDGAPHTENGVPRSLVATYYYAHCAALMANICGILCKPEREEYEKLFDAICHAINREYLDTTTGNYASGKKGCNVFPLALGCVPLEIRPKTLTRVLEEIDENRGHLSTGIFGTPLLFSLLSQEGYEDKAYELITNATYPGYGYMIAKGATTLWECWEQERGSHDHPMFGSISAWFYKYLAGIRMIPGELALRTVEIKPMLPGDLSYVKGELDTPRGKVTVHFERINSGCLYLQVCIPVGLRARIYLPILSNKALVREAGRALNKAEGLGKPEVRENCVIAEAVSGDYRFTIEDNKS